MQEKTLMKISFFLSIAGIISLFFIINIGELPSISIGDISPEYTGRGIKVCGEVQNKFTSKKGHTFFDLKDESGEVKVVVFNNTKANVSDSFICVIGIVDVYEGEQEIIVKRVEND